MREVEVWWQRARDVDGKGQGSFGIFRCARENEEEKRGEMGEKKLRFSLKKNYQ